ncbi:unnamed protein product [Pylaiella littoralis]
MCARVCELDTTGVQSKIRTTPNCRSPCSFGQICVIDSKMSSDTGDDALSPSGRSQPDECWDVCVDNWAEFCKEEKGELPKFQTLRRRELAAAKLRMLIQKLDDEFNRAVLQLGEEDMEGYITAGGEDAWTGFLATARHVLRNLLQGRLGKKLQKNGAKDDKLTNATARVQHMERSKVMVSIFNKIVRSHDAQLRGAVLTLSKQQMDRIVRDNHEKFSGIHKQKDQGKGIEPDGKAATKPLDHAFVTSRVKSAAKSRQAVSLLNQIVSERDSLLKDAIQGMERKEKAKLTNKNNDFLKFEAQRAKQREEFRQTKKTKIVAEHPHATKRVLHQEARAKTTLEQLEETGQKRSKALKTSVKRIPKPQRDSFVRKVNGVTKDIIFCTEKALSVPAPRKPQKKNLDTTRYARAAVMNLSRRVKADVQSAIQVKDDELEKMVATMGEEELRVLVDVGPTGMEDINLWKRDRRKLSWRRLSAFGVVRNDPLLYRQWKQQQHQKVASHAEGTKTDSDEYGEMLGTTCATDVRRRQPWSTDLHYTHKGRTQQMDSTTKSNEEGNKEEKDVLPSDEGTARSGRIPRKCVHTAPSSRTSARRTTSSRPASAPLGAVARIATRPPNQSETARTPSLARLARVFYQSSVASMPCESALEYPAQTAQAPPENVHLEEIDGLETHGHEARNVGSHTEKKIIVQGRETEDNSYGKHKKSDLGGAEKRMESVRLLWAVSQLSADAVTKKVMHGYSERQRAREPNRTRWKTPSRRPQPPGGRCNASVASRRKKHGSCSGRSCVG